MVDGAGQFTLTGDDDDDEDRDELNEVKGEVSRLTGTCPVLTFVAGTRVVITNGATTFDDSCSDIRNRVRVEARGSRAADGTFTATRVEVDDQDLLHLLIELG